MLIKSYVSNGRPLMIDTMNNTYKFTDSYYVKNPKKGKNPKIEKKSGKRWKKPEKNRKSPVKAGFFQVGFFGFFRVGFFGLGFLIPTLPLSLPTCDDQLGNSKFKLLYEPLETDFELSSFGITAPKSFSSSDHTLMKDRARFRAVIIWDHRSKSFSSSDHTLTKDPNWFRAIPHNRSPNLRESLGHGYLVKPETKSQLLWTWL